MDNPYWHIPEGPGPHCQVCGGAWPDGHYPNCPIVTGEAVPGVVGLPAGYRQGDIDFGSLQTAQNLLGQGLQQPISYEVDFVGGPLDGPNPVHPAQNYRLLIQGNTSGYYELLSDFKYHWIDAEALQSDPEPKEVPSTREGFWARFRRLWRPPRSST
jgi:hypothetical protein